VKMGPIRCPETSVNNYHTTPCNYPEDHRFHQHRGGSLKSILYFIVKTCNDSRDRKPNTMTAFRSAVERLVFIILLHFPLQLDLVVPKMP
jgi:hypothetical protein